MKTQNIYIIGMLVLGGCTLQSAPEYGERCTNPTHVNYTKSDECAHRDCPEYQDALDHGYCPQNYRCVNGAKENYCQMDCDANSGLIMCDGKCINPDNDDDFCGARGKCENIKSDSPDYIGKSCKAMNDQDNRYYCLAGSCEINECPVGKHAFVNSDGLKDCEADSNNACGSVNKKCEANEHCIAGKCTQDCGRDSGLILCEQNCVNPLSEKDYCGAKIDDEGKCSYKKCKKDEVCDDGMCVLNKCNSDEKPDLCVDSDSRICVDFKTDAEHCGGCTINCAQQVRQHAVLVSDSNPCKEGKCQFVCQDENGEHYENCGSDGDFVCVNKMRDPDHCGACHHKCEGDTSYCLNGECTASSCQSNQCPITNCENSNTSCGSKCLNCNDFMHGKTTSCSADGECQVTECATGYHLTDANGKKICEPNTDTSCGSTHIANAVDCTQLPNITAGSCVVNEGKCQLTCKSTHHLYDNGEVVVCEENTTENCLKHGANCTLASKAKTMKCNDSKGCQVETCDTQYHISDDYKSCDYNTDYSCGKPNQTGINCNAIYGWKSGTCDKSAGTCKAISCAEDYVLVVDQCYYPCYTATYYNNYYHEYEYYCCDTSELAYDCDSTGSGCWECGNMDNLDEWSTCIRKSLDSSLWKSDYNLLSCPNDLCDEMKKEGARFDVDKLNECYVFR